jgi:hypothetical protein
MIANNLLKNIDYINKKDVAELHLQRLYFKDTPHVAQLDRATVY